jgi:hemolysin D
MNAVTPTEPASAPSPPGKGGRGSDPEFLPAALEVLETPPSPVALGLLLGICAFAAVALAWAWLGWTDIVAVAHGKVQPAGRVKVVQPLETGKVRAILARNGSEVAEGEALVELDPDEALAEMRAAQAAFVSYSAEAVRRAAAIAAAGSSLPAERMSDWPAAIPMPIRAREDAVLRADLAKLAADLASLDAQAGQKRAERERLSSTIVAQQELIATQQERVDMRASLVATRAGTKASLLDAAEALAYQRTVLLTQRGQLNEAEAALETLFAEREKTLRGFVADNETRRAEAQRQADDAEQRLARGRLKVEHTTLRSPVAGVVNASTLTSLGQVLPAGQEVMRIVPRDGVLEVEVYLENKDIGFVREGQDASLKIEAFPFTRYGVIEATVVRVGRDAIPEPEARMAEGDPSRAAMPADPGGAERVRNLVFPVILAAHTDHVMADGRKVPLSPGMAVTAEIRTGERRILDYILSPLAQMSSEALRER